MRVPRNPPLVTCAGQGSHALGPPWWTFGTAPKPGCYRITRSGLCNRLTGSQTRRAAWPWIRDRCVQPPSERAIIWCFDCGLAGGAREWM